MSVRLKIFLFLIGCALLFTSCRRVTNVTSEPEPEEPVREFLKDSMPDRTISRLLQKRDMNKIYGDTIYVDPYGTRVWHDTVMKDDWTAFISVWVDTTDYIIDTVSSSRGNRLVIGYNHQYTIEFRKKNKYWFSLNLNKKENYRDILSETDSWVASNLDVFQNLLYNSQFDAFVAEYSINAKNSFNSLYYIVFDTSGKLIYTGPANSWGGGGPDGDPFLTENGYLYITCSEVYNFKTGTSLNLAEFASIAEYHSNDFEEMDLSQVHALRNLGGNTFLVIFLQSHDLPFYNGLILRADTMLLHRFRYIGFVEDMDAILLYCEVPESRRVFLYDSDREVLICINKNKQYEVSEIKLSEMKKIRHDQSLISRGYKLLDFGFYCNMQFYYAPDSVICYTTDQVD